ncbi:MAG: dTMP kinase, partial [Micromonosporaceae bacterium]|nr:dTMP kinase [Micromonosporaceae bacterium]
DGRTVIEGRSIHSTAVYQSLIAYPNNDDVAYDHAIELLTLAASWRPLPDLTINITDDVETAIGRAERRDNRTYTAEQRQIHRRAADMFARLAQADPDRVTVLDRRLHDADTLVNIMRAQISGLGQLPCLPEPWRATPACPPACGQPVAKLA